MGGISAWDADGVDEGPRDSQGDDGVGNDHGDAAERELKNSGEQHLDGHGRRPALVHVQRAPRGTGISSERRPPCRCFGDREALVAVARHRLVSVFPPLMLELVVPLAPNGNAGSTRRGKLTFIRPFLTRDLISGYVSR